MTLIRRTLRILLVALATLAAVFVTSFILLTQPGWSTDELPDRPSADPEALRKHVEKLAIDLVPRNFRHTDNLDAAADYIAGHLASAGFLVDKETYEAESRTFVNVVARSGRREGPLIVVGAHYDAFGELPGADDNASGVAGLLELARLLSLVDTGARVELVAYSTEEPPYFGSEDMGSAHHAQSLAARGATPRAVLVLEMIGYFTERQPSPLPLVGLLYPSEGDFILVAGRWADRALITDVKRGFRSGTDLRVSSYCGPSAIGTDLSDHRNYWGKGYSAVMITDTAFIRNPNYHTPRDLPETLDYASMAQVVDGVLGAVISLSD